VGNDGYLGAVVAIGAGQPGMGAAEEAAVIGVDEEDVEL
jgi:hypothetical protein